MHQKPAALKWILWLLLPTILTACRATADLGKTTWALVAYGPADAPVAAEAPAWIHFDDNGRMGGHTGCNGIFGHYSAADGRIDIRDDELAYNTRDCGLASAEGKQDAFFRAYLGDTDYTQTADRLILALDDGRQVAEYRLEAAAD